MKLRKDYKKELKIQRALGTLGRYMVSIRSAEKRPNKLFSTSIEGNQWLVSCEIPGAVNEEHAIDVVMMQYKFPETARGYLKAKRMRDER